MHSHRPAIAATGLRKSYGDKLVLDGIDLTVPQGSIFALLDHGRLIAEGTPEQLKRLVPGGHVVLRCTDLGGLERAARLFDAAARDDDALTLQVPGDGTVRSLRALLDRLDSASVEVEELSVHTPDLDDVFLALTGQPDAGRVDKQKEPVR